MRSSVACERRVTVAQVVVGQGQSRPKPWLCPSTSPLPLNVAVRFAWFDQFDGEVICLPGSMKVPYLTFLRLAQHDDAVAKVIGQPQQPGAGLDQRLEHQHARHHRKRREVVRQILLAEGQVLDRPQACPAAPRRSDPRG